MTIISSSIDELEKQNLDKVNLGQHVLAEFFECDSNILNNIDKVEKYPNKIPWDWKNYNFFL